MSIQRMDNVAIVVEDLDSAIEFFTELGMELEGKGQIEGPWADQTVGLDGVRSDIAMMRPPDGHSKLELTKPPRSRRHHRRLGRTDRVTRALPIVGARASRSGVFPSRFNWTPTLT